MRWQLKQRSRRVHTSWRGVGPFGSISPSPNKAPPLGDPPFVRSTLSIPLRSFGGTHFKIIVPIALEFVVESFFLFFLVGFVNISGYVTNWNLLYFFVRI